MELARYPLFAAGVGFFIYGLWGLLRSLRRRCISEGTVIGYEQHEEYSIFAPRVQFTTSDGSATTFQSQLYGSQDIPIGGRIRVRYARSQPERAEIERFSALWLFPLLFLAFGCGFLIASICIPPQAGLRD